VTHKTVIYTSRPKEKFLSVRLLAAAFWVSWFAIEWCRAFSLGDQILLSKTAVVHLIMAILCSLVTYGMNVRTDKDDDE